MLTGKDFFATTLADKNTRYNMLHYKHSVLGKPNNHQRILEKTNTKLIQ